MYPEEVIEVNKVFIPQEPTRRDSTTGELVSLMDFSTAGRFGETVVCLPPGRVALSAQPTIQKLKDVMRDFGDEDFLIAVGDPSVIAMASAVAASNNCGRFKLLKYDGRSKEYITVQIDLHYKPGGLKDAA
jgi:hypothetical protein